MLEPIHERVSVVTAYDQKTGKTSPIRNDARKNAPELLLPLTEEGA